MKTTICCIAKCENRYIKEWVDYHLSLGFSHIYIYDNNNVDGERFETVLKNVPNVSIIDCRGKTSYQNIAYTEFYNEYGKQYDWIAYIDIDEFITFTEESNITSIESFLQRYDDSVDIVHLNWMCYGDNDCLDISTFSVLDRFTTPLKYDKQVQYDFPENNHVKSIIRGGLNIGTTPITVHTPRDGNFKVQDAECNPCNNDYFKPYSFKTAYIRHYVTKTLYEWILKISKGNATQNEGSELYSLERFFLYNNRNEQKENVIKIYDLLKQSFMESISTMNHIQEIEIIKLTEENKRVKNDLFVISNSKAYKIGKSLLKPLKIVFK